MDIEDLDKHLPLQQLARERSHSQVVPKHGNAGAGAAPAAGVPGTQTLYVKTFGCSHNFSDSEYMTGLLRSYGYRFTDRPEAADAWVINSCTVKDPSQASFVNLVRRGKESGVPVVVAGCVPQADRRLGALSGVSVVGVKQIDRIVEVVEQALNGVAVRLLGRGGDLPSLDLPKMRKNPLVEIIPLSTGCLGACTYCKTRHARGKLGSYPLRHIVDRAAAVAAEGVTEIWLSSEDTGAYGLDIGESLGGLLEAVLEALEPHPHCMVRLGMTNPPYVKAQIRRVCAALSHPQAFHFVHVPVQSGSDAVLLAMNREYTRADFEHVADALRAALPNVTVATDVICGFPGETEEHHRETLSLLRKYELAVTNISQFYPRPGTPAAKMKRVHTKVVKDRTREVTRFFEALRPYAYLRDAVIDVWIGHETSKDGRAVGHDRSYVKVLLERGPDAAPGSRVRARVAETHRWHVDAKVLQVTMPPTPATRALLRDHERWQRELAGEPAASREEKVPADGGCGAEECCGGACGTEGGGKGAAETPKDPRGAAAAAAQGAALAVLQAAAAILAALLVAGASGVRDVAGLRAFWDR